MEDMFEIHKQEAEKMRALMSEMAEVNRIGNRGIISADEYVSMTLTIFSNFGYKFSFPFQEEENV